jgi:hypothetical protein
MLQLPDYAYSIASQALDMPDVLKTLTLLSLIQNIKPDQASSINKSPTPINQEHLQKLTKSWIQLSQPFPMIHEHP